MFQFPELPDATSWNSFYLWGPDCDPLSGFWSSPTTIFFHWCRLHFRCSWSWESLSCALTMRYYCIPAMAIVSIWISSAQSLETFSLSLAIRPSTCSCRDLETAPDACSNKLCASSEYALISFSVDSTNDVIVYCWVLSNSLHIFLLAIFMHLWNRL